MAENLSELNLPFNVNYSLPGSSQLLCQNNLGTIPNGPVLPTRPVFPSSLPPSLSQYPSSMQTNILDVKRQAVIANLRTNNLIVDSGVTNSTLVKLRNLPEIEEISQKKNYFYLLVDDNGVVSKQRVSINRNNNFSNNIRNDDINNISNFAFFEDN